MKNKDFFYLQYNKLNWKNQEKTKINSFVNNYIIKTFILKKKEKQIKVFDIGFGIGFFFIMIERIAKSFEKIILEGCEPSIKNYKYFKSKKFDSKKIKIKTFNKDFLNTKTKNKFDFITSIYVFPHFTFICLDKVSKKIYKMLKQNGKFILVVAD
jgi:SAM-dependent methyltransferase